MSWLNLPKKVQKLHRENLLAVSIDFEKYNFVDFKVAIKLITEMGFTWEIDLDNSNVEFLHDYTWSLSHNQTANWHAYIFTALVPWFAPLPVFSIEIFSATKSKVLKSAWSVTFYGAFFRFKELMEEQVPTAIFFYDRVRRLSNLHNAINWEKFIFRRSRIDIAVDVRVPVDQNWDSKFIVPSKNSKQIVHHYNFKKEFGGWQSFSYGASTTRWLAIRIYNKVLDIVSKKKESWYPDIDVEKDTVTRVEIVYYTPFSENNDETIFKSAKSAILGDGEHNISNIMWCDSHIKRVPY